MNGQEIAREIEKRRGRRPNPGTIYPALEDLRRKGMVRKERKGKTTIYSLTKKGKSGIEKACVYFCKAFGQIFEEYKDVCE